MASSRLNTLFFNVAEFTNKLALTSIQQLEDKAYSWMDECLEDARKVLGQPDSHILPKTPGGKQRTRKPAQKNKAVAKKLDLDDDSDATPVKTKPKSRKRQASIESDEDFINTTAESAPVRRNTRATSRAATTSRAKAPTKKPKKQKSKSQEPVVALERLVLAEKYNERTSPAAEVYEETVTWTQSTATALLAPQYRLDAGGTGTCRTPVNNASCIIDSDKTPVNTAKTPIQNFAVMNVKEKVHAYEEIASSNSDRDSTGKKRPTKSKSPQQCNNSPHTPVNSGLTVCNTPDTVVACNKKDSESTPVVVIDDDSPVLSRESTSSSRKSTPRFSVPRRSRSSLRTSLHTLPSTTKKRISAVKKVAAAKPARSRLRLKKKDKPTTEPEAMDTGDDSEEVINLISTPGSTAQQTRRSNTESTSSPDHDEVDAESSPLRSPEEKVEQAMDVEVSSVKKPARSTRTKTRAATNSNTEKSASTTSAGSSVSSVDMEAESSRPRVTRSKMRPANVKKVAELAADSVFTSSSAGSPAARSKMRTPKRQHEDEGEQDMRAHRPKRSCTSLSRTDSENDNNSAATMSSEESMDDDVITSPVKKDVDTAKQASKKPFGVHQKPANLTGLVRSFIPGRNNSPAPKMTMKDIQEKRKKDLFEKERKEKERLRKREEEHKHKMEELRKKREEKAKKVQELRERQNKEQQNKLQQLEKRLAEKRHNIQKVREEKVKEDGEKQRIRLQKMEEAEERRKQEEEERHRKQQEQAEKEKFHEEFLQRKKEFEEQERQQKIEDERKRMAERLQAEQEREKERLRLKQAEEDRHREWLKKKEEREQQLAKERAEKERYELEKKRERDAQSKREMEKLREQERLRQAEAERLKEEQRKRDLQLKQMVDKHNAQVQQPAPVKPTIPQANLNKTHSLEKPTVVSSANNDSYEMTPKRVPVASTADNYGIDDIQESDETDDEENPRKRIPAWAQGNQLKALLINQNYNPPDLDKIFTAVISPDLNEMFERKKARFNKRTSSAHWDTPILKPGLLGRT